MDDKPIYIVGHGKSQKDNPITMRYGQFFIGFIVDSHTSEIIDCEVTAILSITSCFVKDILVGKKLDSDIDIIEQELQNRYFASSQKAILAACKDAQKKYKLIFI